VRRVQEPAGAARARGWRARRKMRLLSGQSRLSRWAQGTRRARVRGARVACVLLAAARLAAAAAAAAALSPHPERQALGRGRPSAHCIVHRSSSRRSEWARRASSPPPVMRRAARGAATNTGARLCHGRTWRLARAREANPHAAQTDLHGGCVVDGCVLQGSARHGRGPRCASPVPTMAASEGSMRALAEAARRATAAAVGGLGGCRCLHLPCTSSLGRAAVAPAHVDARSTTLL
jgi:hypothetical protein